MGWQKLHDKKSAAHENHGVQKQWAELQGHKCWANLTPKPAEEHSHDGAGEGPGLG